MPRLLRVHFSSIGHAHARLAPLTLDFRDEHRNGTDSVVWLRNAGGKSSILNLFFSIFQPARSSFLGSRAEGRARRLDDYVKGTDLAIVVTEWDVDPRNEPSMFQETPREVRFVGQLLAWKGQAESSDSSKLRRLFFSLRGDDQIRFETLPIAKLGAPVSSFEAFREWLDQRQAERPHLEVVRLENNQRAWLEHLEKIGLDPELFRYQIEMNLREGAADERFRFASAQDFVRFFLAMALDTGVPDQVAANLAQLRDELCRRPAHMLELEFIDALSVELRPLADEVASLEGVQEVVKATRAEGAGLLSALGTQTALLETQGQAHEKRAEDLDARAKELDRQNFNCARWASGLERRGYRLENEELRRDLENVERSLAELKRRVRVLDAATILVELNERTAERDAVAKALREAEERLRPRVAELALLGAHLVDLVERARRDADEQRQELDQKIATTTTERAAAKKRADDLRQNVGGLEKSIEHLQERIKALYKAREVLIQQGILTQREKSADAIARLSKLREDTAREGEASRIRIGELGAQRTTIASRREDISTRLGQSRTQAAQLAVDFEAGRTWRARLAVHARILEIQEADEGRPEAPGLERQLRARADECHRARLGLAVDGAEDERALDAIQQTGLLPPSRTVEGVLAALSARGVPAHSGPAYLAENAPSRGSEIIAKDPSRFGGIVITDEKHLERIAAIQSELGERDHPVQVSLAGLTPDASAPKDTLVLPPTRAGAWDPMSAQSAGRELGTRRAERSTKENELAARQSDFSEVAGDVARFIAQHGDGRLDQLGDRARSAREQVGIAERELADLGARDASIGIEIAAQERTVRESDRIVGELVVSLERLHGFVREHEESYPKASSDLDSAREQVIALRAEIEVLDSRHARSEERLGSLREERTVVERELQELEREKAAVDHVAQGVKAPEGLLLADARAVWRRKREAYEHEVSTNPLRGELKQLQETVDREQKRLQEAAKGLDEDAIKAAAARGRLRISEERARVTQSHDDVQGQIAVTRSRIAEVQKRLDEGPRRRQRDDLPPDLAEPTTSGEARKLAERFKSDAAKAAEGHTQSKLELSEAQNLATTCRSRAEFRKNEARLMTKALGEGTVLGPEREIPQKDDELRALLFGFHDRLEKAALLEGTARKHAVERAETVRRLAHSERFNEHKSQVRERLRAPVEEILPRAAEFRDRLATRRTVLNAALRELDEHRRVVLREIEGVASEAQRLLDRADNASVLPESLGAWGGRSFLSIHADPPKSADERVALLEPIVQEIVDAGAIPTGLELVQRAVIALAPRGHRVTILKPDAVLRPERIDIVDLSTFSRGQQLTAAILLYCTLAQLRARARGRSRGRRDAGVLILDNPIGTCSSAPLLDLQRSVARDLQVQLVYTTGVHDLDALATMPNVIRLANSHRDLETGDMHVTEGDARVEGIRVVRVSPS